MAHVYLDAPLLDFSTLQGWNLKNVRATYNITDPDYSGANDPRQPVNCAATQLVYDDLVKTRGNDTDLHPFLRNNFSFY